MFRVWSPRPSIAISPLADFTPSPNTRWKMSTKVLCTNFLKTPRGPGVQDILVQFPGHPRFPPSKPKEDRLSRVATSLAWYKCQSSQNAQRCLRESETPQNTALHRARDCFGTLTPEAQTHLSHSPLSTFGHFGCFGTCARPAGSQWIEGGNELFDHHPFVRNTPISSHGRPPPDPAIFGPKS